MADIKTSIKRKSNKASKKKRLVITLEQKFDIIDKHERGISNSDIGRVVGMSESTVRNIIKHSEEIKEKGRVAEGFCGLQTSTRRNITLIEMERLLSNWIEECHKKGVTLSRAKIQAEALNIYNIVKKKYNCKEKFIASVGWYDRFKSRLLQRNAKLSAENSKNEETFKYHDVFEKMIQDGAYVGHQIFDPDENDFSNVRSSSWFYFYFRFDVFYYQL